MIKNVIVQVETHAEIPLVCIQVEYQLHTGTKLASGKIMYCMFIIAGISNEGEDRKMFVGHGSELTK